MPTIEELAQAPAVSDEDFLPVSQAGVMKRVTRSQMLAGIQPALAVAQGGMLGRTSAGVGEPEAIAIGDHLQLSNGVLSGVTPFSVTGLAASGSVGITDLVAVSHGGRDTGVPVGVLLSAISDVPGLDLSQQVVRAGSGAARSLSTWLGDGLTVEAFGAVGDGVTDDTAAIDRAVTSSKVVRFGPRTYVLNGQWTITGAAVLLGVPGQTVLLRTNQVGGAWISVSGPRFSATDIVFDGGSLTGESWGVLIGPSCTYTLFEACTFRGVTGPTLGSGLTIQARDGNSGSPSRHVVRGCESYGNAAHGIWVQAAAGAIVEGCLAYDNGSYGICFDFNDPTFLQQVRHGQISGCRAWGNRRGISVGNYNETNLEPPRWGNLNPDAVGVVVSHNRCHDNFDYGIAVSGLSIQVVGNLVEENGAGILLNAVSSLVSGNVIVGPGQYGIDAGGSETSELRGNLIQGFAVGINPGGSRNAVVAGNGLIANVWGITAFGMETDGHGTPFGIECEGLTIDGNRILLKDGSGGGVLLADAPQGTAIVGNSFGGGVSCNPSQALWAHTDQIVVKDNLWNNQARLICNPVLVGDNAQLQLPDLLDGVMLTSAPEAVGSIVGQHQAAMTGQVTFIRITAGGSGYTRASVVIQGSGRGASAIAYVRDGAVVGVAMQSYGYGYGNSGVNVTIQGDGQGAQAIGTVGIPVPDGRRIRLHCNGPVRFKRVGSSPFQDNWTGIDILVSQASVVEWVGTWGGWQAVAFPLADYLAPTGDGGMSLRSASGDVALRPAGGGHVRISSDGEPVGFSSLLGRGSPEGMVTAPPGSDYRNLDGGAGTTLWVKRIGGGATGWVAVV